MWLANKFPSVKRLLVQRDNLLSKLDKSAQTPLPPGPLRARVGMTDDEGTFLRIGASIAQDIFWLLDKYGHPIGNSRILDFGCGCGRVARWMPVGLNVTGCDVDREAIGWCQTNLARIGRFVLMEPGPPLEAIALTDSLFSAGVARTALLTCLLGLTKADIGRPVESQVDDDSDSPGD